MKSLTSWIIGAIIVLIVVLTGYWFWVPDVGALRTWNEFLDLPTMKCIIGDSSVHGLSGEMFIGHGRLRADYKVEGDGVSSTFHTIVYEEGSTYTWADTIDFAQKSVLNLGDASTQSNLFKISRCKRIWNLDPEMFVLPIGKDFKDVNAVQATTTDAVTSH